MITKFLNVRTAASILIGFIIIAIADISLALSIAHALKVASNSDNFIVEISAGFLSNDLTGVFWLIITFILFIFLRFFIMKRAAEISYKYIYNLYVLFSTRLLHECCRDSASALKSSATGFISKRLQNDTNLFFGGLIIPACNLFVELLVIFAIIGYASIEIGLGNALIVSIPFLLFTLIVAWWYKKKTLYLGNLRNKEEDIKSSFLVNCERSILEVAIFNAENFILERFEKINNRLVKISAAQNVNLLLSRISFESIFSLGLFSIILLPFIFSLLSTSQYSINEDVIGLVAIIAVRLFPGLSRAIQMVQSMAFVWQTSKDLIKNSMVTEEGLISLKAIQSEPTRSQIPSNESILDWNKFEIYRGDRQLISGENFYLQHGEFVSIFGKSGAGKTTFLSAIFLHFDTGPKFPKQKIVWIRQDPGFISRDIIENITLDSRERVNWQRLAEALRMAGFDGSFFKEIESNSFRADQLSGGQIQRINLARAFYHDAQILLLDEFTSALDTDTELEIFSTLLELKKEGLAAIIVSHRDAVKRFTDRIYFIQEGKLKQN